MKVPGHLLIEEVKLPAGQEWTDATAAWRFVRLGGGAAYWLGPNLARPLAEGEVVVVPPPGQGAVRASQISEAVLQSFSFSPEHLCGFLTLAERHFFETRAAAGKPEVRFLPSTHPVAQRFSAIAAESPLRSAMSQRAQVLGVVALHFAEDFARHRAPTTRSASALQRFKQIVEKMPDSEITNQSSDELARLCGCSPRHFSRLFRQHYRVSLRAKQTELRLLKARQLLAETGAKIVHVALESGYQNLSLFNSMFKKRFGMTPSESRRKSSRKPGRLARAAAVLFLAAWCGATGSRAAETNTAPAAAHLVLAPPKLSDLDPTARAQEALRRKMAELSAEEKGTNAAVPGAGTNAAPAAVSTNAGPAFAVNGYEVRGNTLLPPAIIDPIFQKQIGQAVTLDLIRQARAELQMAYHDRGFVTVAVALPQQQLTNGIVQVQVIEGRLAEITVVNNRHFSSNNVMRELPSLRTNALLNGLVLQQEVDRANANRDRQIYPLLGPGPDPGTSELTLKIKDRLPLHARFELNNNATPDTPELRMNVAAQYNNLWQLDHQFGVQYSFTPGQLKPQSQGAFVYDGPLVANYSAFYRMPLSGVNGPPHGRDYTVADFGYDEVTHRFRPPQALGSGELLFYASRSSSDTDKTLQTDTLTPPINFPGLPLFTSPGGPQLDDQIFSDSLTINENLGARLAKPLPEFAGVNSTLSVGVDFKNYRLTTLQNHVFEVTIFVPQVGTNGPPFTEIPSGQQIGSSRTVFNSLQYLPFSIGWNGSKADKFGSTALDVNGSFNFSGLIGSRQEFQAVAGSTKTDGNYVILTAGLARDQNLYRGWGLRLHADGQWANQPLISNEQFGIGGAAGVRGYHDGEQYGDTGWRVQFEPHSPFLNLGLVDNKVPLLMRLYTFVDYGERYLLDPGSRKRAVPLLGVGFGFNASIGEHLDFRLQAGVALRDTPASAGLDPIQTRSGDCRVTFGLGAQF